ncbi:hypothetical protein ABT56_16855 [Photobacterium aquae]|uniref:Uncharacterized protein n=1 Tax=Photobacterium aquae TaxID=1195763 RepID=A0A0J1JNU6_9GAMM|nr:DUF1315 family protein [Photobacterium aquae]KLV03902.1 hypothetical protein ABT56_16855 [Photobacterium aquae]
MELEQLLNAMTPEVYLRMCQAVETGKWPDGTPLTDAQKDSALQAVMLYQSRYNTEAEHMTVAQGGELKFKSKAELKRDFSVDEKEDEAVEIARFDHRQL